MMGGEFDEALPLLHRKLVIHEKFGPDDSVGDTLQQLGTAYRLYANHTLAAQHLEKALDRREKKAAAAATASQDGGALSTSRKDNQKVAETLNSLALLYHVQGNAAIADDYHTRSLVRYAACVGEDDSQSEDIPWEVFKRMQSAAPSVAQNSMTLLKTNLRMAMQADAAVASTTSPKPNTFNLPVASHLKAAQDTTDQNTLRVRKHRSLSLGSSPLSAHGGPANDLHAQGWNNISVPRNNGSTTTTTPSLRHHQHHVSADTAAALTGPSQPLVPRGDRPVPHEPITSFAVLVARIENVKRSVAAGPSIVVVRLCLTHFIAGRSAVVEPDVNRLACDIALIAAGDLRQVGLSMLGLLHDALKLSKQLDQRQVPVLEGYLDKKSSSLFRGWERRWFKLDTRTGVLTYFHSQDDQARGFAPRGTFALSRISHLVTHQHLRGSHYAFDIVVDMSTRSNPHACRTFELRCNSESDLNDWVNAIDKFQKVANDGASTSVATRTSDLS
ncbi:hypothetical protein DYB26_008956 [Aphanomyces astaci]|uniref:PH domain-containing protein n=1 Tax=Aphanomyces astaci TaxID=112090 RepID=A0A3R6XHF5_APHAT|nr:hypothetical protein DYB26_004223 [Aphanomyces astaci]RHY82135.1 hypothetical protein DYB26_008956 [Aphanomyces astaci]